MLTYRYEPFPASGCMVAWMAMEIKVRSGAASPRRLDGRGRSELRRDDDWTEHSRW